MMRASLCCSRILESSAPAAGFATCASTTYTTALGIGKWRKSGPRVDSKCLKTVLNAGFASTRWNSLRTRGCGEIRQTCNAFFLAGFFTDFEVIGTVNREQDLVKGKLRRRTTVTEWRLESPETTALPCLAAGFLLGQSSPWNLASGFPT